MTSHAHADYAPEPNQTGISAWGELDVSKQQHKITPPKSPHLDHRYRRALELLHRQIEEDEVPTADHVAESLDGIRRAELIARVVKQREGVAHVKAGVDASKLEWRRLDAVVLASLVGVFPAELRRERQASAKESLRI